MIKNQKTIEYDSATAVSAFENLYSCRSSSLTEKKTQELLSQSVTFYQL